VGRNARLEHRRIVGRLGPREFEIGLAKAVKRLRRRGLAVIPGARQRLLELIEPALCDIRQQFVAIAIVPIRRGGTAAGPARRFGKSEARRALLSDQLERRADQGFLQVAVVIAAGFAAAVLGPAHVNSTYITAGGASTVA